MMTSAALPLPWRYLLPLLCLPLLAGPAAADAIRVPLTSPAQVTCGVLPGTLAANYSAYRVTALPGGEGVRWTFTVGPHSRGNAQLYCMWNPPATCGKYRVTVRVVSGTPKMKLFLWLLPEVDFDARPGADATPGKWQTLEEPAESAPAWRLGLDVGYLEPGRKYVIDWQSVEALPGDKTFPPAAAPPAPAPADLSSPGTLIVDLSDLRETPEPPETPATEMPHLYRLPAAAAFSPYGQSADTWLGPGQYDYTELDRRLAALVAEDPQAQVLLQVPLDSPPWWEALHPEALAPSPAAPPELCAERKLTHASWYSPAWREAAREALRNLVKHVEAGPWAGRVLGYELESGRAGRWVPWHQAAEFQETSPVAQAAYRRWLETKYGSLVELRSAWGQPRQPWAESPEVQAGYIFTQWAQIKLPALASMLDPKAPTLYDPSGQQDLADYQQFLGEHTAEVILDLVRAGREVAAPSRQWGACYGHLLWWPEGDWPPSLSGQLGLGKLLAADEINFLVGPPGAPARPTSAVSSVNLRHKVYLEQLPGEDVGGVGLVHGGYLAPSGPRAPAPAPAGPRWALVVDERSLSHLSPGTDLQRVTLRTQAEELQKIGWPDVWLAGDLPASDPTKYGGYLMAATYFLPVEVLATITVRAREPGTVSVWLYGAGTLDSGYIDPSAIFRLTGLKATVFNSPGSQRVEVPPGEPYFTPESDQPLSWGPLLLVQPRFVLISGDETVGSMKGSNWPGVGLRWDKGALYMYSAAPGVPGEALRRMEEEARRKAGL